MFRKMVLDLSNRLSAWLEIMAGVALILGMLLTGADIVGRALRHPIPGTYEIVSFIGALVIGLAIPITSRARAHVLVDIVSSRVSKNIAIVLHIITRLMIMALFVLIGYALFKMGITLRDTGEHTSVLALPFYPVALATGVACFVECLILVGDLLRDRGEGHE
jgi:TRAP-type C4-dicarboxylate transport system permease small subunit